MLCSKLVIINNDGGDAVVGTFNGIAEGASISAAGNIFKISYAGGSGNDVTLEALSQLALNIKASDTPPTEGVPLVVNGQFSVFLSQPVTNNVVVNFTVSGGAVPGAAPTIGVSGNPNDYQEIQPLAGTTKTVTILAGFTEALVPVNVFDDLTAEDPAKETVVITLVNINGSPLGALPSVSVSNATRVSNVATITTPTAHGLFLGQTFTVAGVADASFNGTFVIRSVPTNNTFTYASVGANASSAGTGNVLGSRIATVNIGDSEASFYH